MQCVWIEWIILRHRRRLDDDDIEVAVCKH